MSSEDESEEEEKKVEEVERSEVVVVGLEIGLSKDLISGVVVVVVLWSSS